MRHTIFRKPTSLPEEDIIDINRPIDNTTYLAEVLKRLPEGSARKEPLMLLSDQVVEQFRLRLVRTPAILQEVVALGSIPDPRLLHKILQQFLNLLVQEAALDVDLLEGLAVLLETAHPQALRGKSTDSKTDEKESVAEEKSTLDQLKEKATTVGEKILKETVGSTMAPLVMKTGKSALEAVGKGIEKSKQTVSHLSAQYQASQLKETLSSAADTVTQLESVVRSTVNKKIGSLRDAFQTLLIERGLIKEPLFTDNLSPIPISDVTSSSSSATTTSSTANQETMIQTDEKYPIRSQPQKLRPAGSATDRYSQITHLLLLLDKLTDKYTAMHRQSQTAIQEAEILRALGRVLDAMRDIGVTGISKEKVRKKVYDALVGSANNRNADPAVSLWANYAIQALIRLEDNGSMMSEWIARGKNLLTVVKSLKEVWNTWDLTQLSQAYDAGKEAFKIDHQPESWYESLWYCQLLIRAGQFQDLEEYLYQNKPGKSDCPLCPDRCMPAFQLGLMATLDGVIRDPKWSEPIKAGCFQLLQDMFLNEKHWYTEPAQSKDPTWREYLEEKGQKAKKLVLYSGRAYQARKEAVQGAILDQLVAYLNEPALYQTAQGVFSALRHPRVKPPLTKNQSQLLEEHAPLAKLYKASQSNLVSTPAKPSQILLVPAKEAVEKHLVWKLETLRADDLSTSETDQRLAYYVPPKSLRKDQDKDPPFDLMEGSLYFLGLLAEDPAQKHPEVKGTGMADSMSDPKESGPAEYPYLHEEKYSEEKERKIQDNHFFDSPGENFISREPAYEEQQVEALLKESGINVDITMPLPEKVEREIQQEEKNIKVGKKTKRKRKKKKK